MSKNKIILFIGLPTILLIILKTIDFIQWSWLWVLFPLWGIPIIYIFVIGIITIYFLLTEL